MIQTKQVHCHQDILSKIDNDIDKMSILIFLSFITVPDVDEPLNITSVTTENTGNANTTCFKSSQMTQETRVMFTQHVLKVLK
jgi:hypothetical protein